MKVVRHSDKKENAGRKGEKGKKRKEKQRKKKGKKTGTGTGTGKSFLPTLKFFFFLNNTKNSQPHNINHTII